ncbi:hypothetical protein IJ135_00475 [Candidatus Saccharibacteria bacterium]|nr:hypothetical protein [Candidatus Saccharibacteria bacterium]
MKKFRIDVSQYSYTLEGRLSIDEASFRRLEKRYKKEYRNYLNSPEFKNEYFSLRFFKEKALMITSLEIYGWDLEVEFLRYDDEFDKRGVLEDYPGEQLITWTATLDADWAFEEGLTFLATPAERISRLSAIPETLEAPEGGAIVRLTADGGKRIREATCGGERIFSYRKFKGDHSPRVRLL